MWKDSSHGREKDISLFDKVQAIGMHQAENTPKKIIETTKIGIGTV